MANIPIERKEGGGVPWWAWLLGLLVLGLLAYMLLRGNDHSDEVAAVDTTTAQATPPDGLAAAGAITTLDTVYVTADRSSLVGRQVRLTDVVVPELTGDSTFVVASQQDPSQKVLIALEGVREKEEGSSTGDDGRYEVNKGDTLDLEGTLSEMTPEQARAWKVSSAPGTPDWYYIRARRVAQ